MRGVSNSLVRRVALGALLAAALLVLVLVTTSGGGGHDVYVTKPQATGAIVGQYVREGGREVGKISEIKAVDGGRAARLKLTLKDSAWPLPRGTTMRLRWGGTINSYDRYIALERGEPSAPSMVDDGGELPASALTVPVEYGELVKVFQPRLRDDLKRMVDNTGRAIDATSANLRRALPEAPPVVEQADRVLRDLNHDEVALETLVASTAGVLDAVDRSSPGVSELVTGTADTFDAIADRADDAQAMLDEAPSTFAQARDTLNRADPTLVAARDLTARLAPGVTELRRLAAPLNSTLGTLADVGPTARRTLDTAAGAAPPVTRLLDTATGLAPQMRSLFAQADEALNCIRPYSPELATFGSLWSSHISSTDGNDPYVRANVESFVPAPTTIETKTPAEAKAQHPGLRYSFPMVPGYWAGQPWFIPECGITPDALDPSKDPEVNAVPDRDEMDP